LIDQAKNDFFISGRIILIATNVGAGFLNHDHALSIVRPRQVREEDQVGFNMAP